MTNIMLFFLQLILMISYFIPINSKEFNLILSKYFIHILSTIIYLPSIILST
jgi:hypothetical protein